MRTCAIIGAGQIGSRHLQAVANLRIPLQVIMVDPSTDALQRSEQLFRESACTDQQVQSRYITDQDQLPSKLDFAIVATNARHRLSVLEKLLDQCSVEYLILEKFLFQARDSFHAATSLLQGQLSTTWVNCHRRLWPIYREIKEQLGHSKIRYRISGSQWGLGCNSIHFIDHLAFLTGDTKYSLHATHLTVEETTKRTGFVDFTGSLRGETGNGSEFEIVCSDQPGLPIELSIATEEIEFYINESAQTGWYQRCGDAPVRVDMSFRSPYVSETTQIALEEILSQGKCNLGSFQDSVALHLPLLDAFLDSYKEQIDETAALCPIT